MLVEVSWFDSLQWKLLEGLLSIMNVGSYPALLFAMKTVLFQRFSGGARVDILGPLRLETLSLRGPYHRLSSCVLSRPGSVYSIQAGFTMLQIWCLINIRSHPNEDLIPLAHLIPVLPGRSASRHETTTLSRLQRRTGRASSLGTYPLTQPALTDIDK